MPSESKPKVTKTENGWEFDFGGHRVGVGKDQAKTEAEALKIAQQDLASYKQSKKELGEE